MINAESTILECINSPVRSVCGRVELYEGSTLLNAFKHTDKLVSFSIERVAEVGKFFGFGICQKANVKLIDFNRELDISTAYFLDIALGAGSDYAYPFPHFMISRVNRDESTNQLSITAYDAIYGASNHTFAELGLTAPYTIKDVAVACATLLGLPFGIENVNDNCFNTSYEVGANFEGTETIREVLDAIAGATQTIYYVNNNWQLTFKRLDKDGEAVLTIDKDKYISLDSGNNRRLSSICHATELGDNVGASLAVSGTTQYVRDNPFWELREDIDTLVENALSAVGGLTINQFDCSWRGNYLLEIGDKIALTAKDDSLVYSFLLDDTITFDGGLSEISQWEYQEEEESEANPSSLGDALRQTYARVDKANKQIEMVASKAEENGNAIASLQMTTDNIKMSVAKTQEETSELLEEVNTDIATLTNKVEASMTAEDVSIQIQSVLDDGVSRVETATGFTFNEEGLSISKSGSEITTTITEDGMTVYRNNEAVLTADNEGVKAEDLHATTYLIVGSYSRFEDYGTGRTGCFWIG